MKSHLITLARPGLDRSKSFGIELVSTHGEVIDDYDLIFRELFCVAAATLCDRMNQPLTAAGLLWDEILPTGAFNEKSRANLKKSSSVTSVGEKAASLSGQEEYGRGSLLFLVRHVDDRDAARLASAGYRFAEVHQVASVLRSRMQIQSGEIESKLRQMASYAENNAEPARGVHLGFFGMRARVNTSGFSVLVNKNSRSTLPTVSMKLSNLDAVQRDFLQRFNGSTVLAMLQALEKPPTSSMTALDTKFAENLLSAITELRGYIRDPLFDEALFSPRTFTVPITRGDRTETMELLAFRLVIPIHSVLISPTCEFIPLTFFKVQQASLQDQLVFSQGVHRELGPVVKQGMAMYPEGRQGFVRRWANKRASHLKDIDGAEGSPIVRITERRASVVKSIQSSSTVELVRDEASQSHHTIGQVDSGSYGGILVSQEITVGIEAAAPTPPPKAAGQDRLERIGSRDTGANGAMGVELKNLGRTAGASHGDGRMRIAEIGGSFVDLLFAQCVEGR
jgi:hypothetical protein